MSSRLGSRGRSVLATIGLVGLSVVFALGIAEIAVRVLAADLNPDQRLRYHPGLGWTSDPDFRRFDHVNSQGFRHQVSPANPEGRRRLVILGDSFSFGGAYPFAQTYAGRLDEWLGSAGGASQRPWDVISLASGGFGTGQELLALRQYGLEFEPDAVVLQVFPYNDPCNNNILQAFTCSFLDSHRPYFVVEGDRLRVTELSPTRGLLRRGSRLFGLFESRRRWGFPDTWKRLPPGRPRGAGLQLAQALRAGLSFESNLYSLVPHRDQPPMIRSGWLVTEAIIREIADLLVERQVPLVAVVIPYVQTFRPDWKKLRPKGRPPLVADHGTARIEEILRDAGARVISLRQRVLERSELPREFFYPTENDRHMNDRGHHLVATAILEELHALGLSDRSAPPYWPALRPLISGRDLSGVWSDP